MSTRGVKAWVGRALVAVALGTIGVSASAKPADVSPPPSAEEDEAVAPLDQADNDPPFGSFLGACNDDSDCSGSSSCQSFRKRGSHCTHTCESGSDCSGTRCTKQGRCGLMQPIKTTK